MAEPKREITLQEAHRIQPNAQVGETVEIETELPHSAGRIAAQTAKQVVLQRLREAERKLVYEEYADKEGDILTGQIQRFEANRQIIVDVGKAEAVLPLAEQVPTERLRPHQRLRVYVLEVRDASKGPEIIVSRTHRNLLRHLMALEIPEIYNGIVEIMAIAREPGFRSKVAVVARQDGVDAVGSCVGMRGNRIQNIVKELQDEKIDVIQWHRDPTTFIANALSPAQVLRVELDEATNEALVVVPDRHLSLAIGREGQNARLAAKVTGWKIDIKSSSDLEAERLQRIAEAQGVATEALVETPVGDEEAVEGPAVLQEAVSEMPAPAVAEPVIASAAEEASAPEPIIAPATAEAPAAEPVGVAPQGGPSITPEEELALQSLEEELARPEETDEEEEEELLAEDGEAKDIWSIPQAVKSPSGIRFAEDILGPRGFRGRRGRGNQGEDDRPRKGRKGRSSPSPVAQPAEEEPQ